MIVNFVRMIYTDLDQTPLALSEYKIILHSAEGGFILLMLRYFANGYFELIA